MHPPWLIPKEVEDEAAPPWVQHSRMQTQQEICAQRFLRFASLRHAHAVIVLWSMAMWFAGIHPMLMSAPMVYFSGAIGLGHWYRRFGSVDGLSGAILILNGLNAAHLATLCAIEGDKVLTSPMFAFVPLSRIVFGMFTQCVNLHLGLSTLQTFLTIMYNCDRVAGDETLLVILVLLLLELTVVLALAEGPCGYEEAIMHLTHFRSQHQLHKSQAVQHVDMEREEFSGQLLAIATQGIAELTAAVENASQPVIDMLKASCATGTKSAREAEQIGLVGEDLKERVGQILRFKTQAAWSALQEKAKERSRQLQNRAVLQHETTKSVLDHLHQRVGQSLVRMYELELESEASLEQFIQSEVNRAMETADSRMDLVRQAAHAMNRRIADTVEVLLSILRYFRSKGLHVQALNVHTRPSKESQGRMHRRMEGSVVPTSTRLASIHERAGGDAQGEHSQADHTFEEPTHAAEATALRAVSPRSAGSNSSQSGISTEAASNATDEATSLATDVENATASQPPSSEAYVSETVASDAVTSEAEASETEPSSGEEGGSQRDEKAGKASGKAVKGARSIANDDNSANSATEECAGDQETAPAGANHPLFASRLSYRSEEFFWSWASSFDFRSEMDALRQWKRARARQKAQEEEAAAAAAAAAAAEGEVFDKDDCPGAESEGEVCTSAESSPAMPRVCASSDTAADRGLKASPPARPKATISKPPPRHVYIDLSAMQKPAQLEPVAPSNEEASQSSDISDPWNPEAQSHEEAPQSPGLSFTLNPGAAPFQVPQEAAFQPQDDFSNYQWNPSAAAFEPQDELNVDAQSCASSISSVFIAH